MSIHPLLLLILSACAVETSGTACIQADDDATECPDGADVDVAEAFVPNTCDAPDVSSVSGAGSLEPMPSGQAEDSGVSSDLICCYDAQLIDPTQYSDCMAGRPLDGHVHAQLAGPTRGRTPRQEAWISAALGEHASVGAFAKLALELMAHSAPLALIRDVLAAAEDEIAHAEHCFTQAGGGSAGPLPVPAFDPARSLAAIAGEAVRDGCIIETLGAIAARAAAQATVDPGAKATLAVLCADEERHAVLSWRVVAWALAVGGPDVRQAVEVAFGEPVQPLDVRALALRADVDGGLLQSALRSGLDRVVTPAARALLGRPAQPTAAA